jgi:hypothetical protein
VSLILPQALVAFPRILLSCATIYPKHRESGPSGTLFRVSISWHFLLLTDSGKRAGDTSLMRLLVLHPV